MLTDVTTLERAHAQDSHSHQRIAVHTLALTGFRNYAALRLETGGAPVVLTGPNGAGKTNILEAVSLLAPGRGLRRAKLGDMDARSGGDTQPWVISAQAETPLGDVQIGTGRDTLAADTDKRLVRVDGRQLKNHNELAQYVAAVWLTPQMDQLFQEGQSARRKFLDRLVYGFDSEHASRVSAFEYAMRERNRLLSERRGDAQWLSSLERKMAETSVAIAAARRQTVSHLNEEMLRSRHSFPKAEMALSGFAEELFACGEPAVLIEQAFMETLEKSRRDDAASGRSGVGAHRSELQVTHLIKDMEAAYCSTGEQKALLLAIVLAEARAGAHWHGRVPLILLDEMVAHLDPQKRQELCDEIQSLGAQVWMTGTDPDFFHGMRDKACFFRVEMGSIIPA